MSCHAAIQKSLRNADMTVALAGNPNVGKSTLFNTLTGLQADTANYPGKTVDLNLGLTKYNGKTIGLIDLPGTYSLDATSDDQWVARRALIDEKPNVVLVVLDASNLQRNLYQTLQLIELGLPLVIVLNLVDHAERLGIKSDCGRLSKLLGVPVIRMVASKGEGVEELLEFLTNAMPATPAKGDTSFGRSIDFAVGEIEEAITKSSLHERVGLNAHALALRLLENDSEFTQLISVENNGLLKLVEDRRASIESEYHEVANLAIARERHALAKQIAETVQSRSTTAPLLSQRIMHFAVSPYTGVPLAMVIIASIFVFMLKVGGLLGDVTSFFWVSYASPAIRFAIVSSVGKGLLSKILLWGFDAGILGALSVGIPYVLTFFLILSLLEDSGYLGCLAYLADSLMHKLGLHGRAIIPIIMGFGCNVPAVMGTRVLETKRERLLASTLITLTPCSARTAVIIAAVGYFAGWQYAVAIFGIDLAVIAIIGAILGKLLPGKTSGLVMEMFTFRRPKVSTILKRTWFRFKVFMEMALPLIVIGSIVLGALDETGWLQILLAPVNPIMLTLLGLPAVASICLVLGILRKELTLQLLIALAIVKYGPSASNLLQFMSPLQLFVFGVVVTLYFPCIATMTALGREVGWKSTITIVVSTITLAVFIGGVAFRTLPALNLLH
ncbi:MAG TPA: ferrous iron transport protein B [Terriglobales bacterium]|nr:ferrous iron transport protein B [Terriglobales bacterium]